MQIDLAQELLLSHRVDLILQSISVSFDSRVFDVQLFQLVICNVRIHLIAGSPEKLPNKTTREAGRKCGEFVGCALFRRRLSEVFKAFSSISMPRHARSRSSLSPQCPGLSILHSILCFTFCYSRIDMWYPRIRLAGHGMQCGLRKIPRLNPCGGELFRQIGESSSGRGQVVTWCILDDKAVRVISLERK
jgi:hypothetical protein